MPKNEAFPLGGGQGEGVMTHTSSSKSDESQQVPGDETFFSFQNVTSTGFFMNPEAVGY